MELHEATLDRTAGRELLDRLQAPSAQEPLLTWLEGLVPGFADWMVTALFGGTYQRDGLSLRDRQLVNLATLATLGGVEPQLSGHVRTSLRVGMAPAEILEVMVHLAPYIGTPKALAGLRVVAAALTES